MPTSKNSPAVARPFFSCPATPASPERHGDWIDSTCWCWSSKKTEKHTNADTRWRMDPAAKIGVGCGFCFMWLLCPKESVGLFGDKFGLDEAGLV